jgi:O-antigen/teichoic acid export membrane protein
MKIGQTSFVVFVSKLIGSALGFLATLYFARQLGAEVIGLYALIQTVVGWLTLGVDLGIGEAIIKRISEGKEQGKYLTAAGFWVVLMTVLVSVAVVLGTPFFESYISGFEQYVTISVVWFVVLIIITKLFYKVTFRILNGERKVHISGVLESVRIAVTSLLQILLVFIGYDLLGMLIGQILAGILIGCIGLFWVTTRPKWPNRRHFQSLFHYAKFSWLGSLKGRVLNRVDILFLGLFVSTPLVGVYSVAWSLAKFLDLFSGAVKGAIFPEISHISTQESDNAAAGLVEDALAYAGLIVIPGLVGGSLLADRLLRFYGNKFVEGTTTFSLLIFAIFLLSYQKQLLGGLNGLDRPDLAFTVNVVFITLNASLNLILIWLYGIEGAAAASFISTGISVVIAHHLLSKLITFSLPVVQIFRQFAAAAAMGVFVLIGLNFAEASSMTDQNVLVVLVLVGLGAGIYFLILLGISSEFRETVARNFPIN